MKVIVNPPELVPDPRGPIVGGNGKRYRKDPARAIERINGEAKKGRRRWR